MRTMSKIFDSNRLHLRRVERQRDVPLELPLWLQRIPAVTDVFSGIDFGLTTVLVGENGTGKSTVLEALAFGLDLPLGGGTSWEIRSHAESPPVLAGLLNIIRGVERPNGACFLRAETMHENMTYLMSIGSERGHSYSVRSHGEMFIDMLSGRDHVSNRFASAGLWLLDEPESALSFMSSLSLIQLIRERQKAGLQTVMATHSPLLAAVDGAMVLELSEHGLRRTTWKELEMVDHWRRFLSDPLRYTRHLD